MKKQKLEKAILKEIEVLNQKIDERIIRGLSYSREARRHKFLLGSLNDLRRQKPVSGWFRSLTLARTFLF